MRLKKILDAFKAIFSVPHHLMRSDAHRVHRLLVLVVDQGDLLNLLHVVKVVLLLNFDSWLGRFIWRLQQDGSFYRQFTLRSSNGVNAHAYACMQTLASTNCC